MRIETWSRLPAAVRDHLVKRMHDRNIGEGAETLAGSVNRMPFSSGCESKSNIKGRCPAPFRILC
jgi:hypothetical protein